MMMMYIHLNDFFHNTAETAVALADIKNGFVVEFYPKLIGLPFLGVKKQVTAKMRKCLTFNPFENKKAHGKKLKNIDPCPIAFSLRHLIFVIG